MTTQVEIQQENQFFHKTKTATPQNNSPSFPVVLLIVTAFITTVWLIEQQVKHNTKPITNAKYSQNITNNNIIPKLSSGKIYELNQFILNNEKNEIKNINILYWKLKFINKMKPDYLTNVNIDEILNLTHKSYVQMQQVLKNNQETSNKQKITPEILKSNKKLYEFLTDINLETPPLVPVYQEFVDEYAINKSITDKVAFSDYLTDNRFNIISTENLFLNKYTDIIHKYDLIPPPLPPLPSQQWNVYNTNDLTTNH